MRKILSLILILISLSSYAQMNRWNIITPDDKKFSISFPCIPKQESSVSQNESGPFTIVSYSCLFDNNTDENLLYQFGFVQLSVSIPPDSTHHAVETMDSFIEGLQEDLKGEILETLELSIGPFSGRQYKFAVKADEALLFYYYRLFMVNDRLYYMQIAMEESFDKNPSMLYFLNSFGIY